MNWLSSFLKTKPSVSVIVLEGEIGEKKSLSLKKIKKKIEKAFKKPNLVAVALQINSNGGSPVQSQLIANYLVARYNIFLSSQPTEVLVAFEDESAHLI